MIYDGYDCVIDKPEMDDIFIAHYGVKGMKWRRRKGRKKASLNSNLKTRKARSNKDFVKAESQFNEFVKRYDEAKTDEEKKAMATAAGNAGFRVTGRPGYVTNIGGRLEEIYKKKKKQ